jgi:DNA polymerase III epsilon subunit-like protein
MAFLCVFDEETTGLNTQKDCIVQVSATKLHPFTFQKLASYTAFVRSPVAVPAEVTRHTGIGEQHLMNAKSFKDHAVPLAAVMDQCVWVGHNIHAFDIPILLREYAACGVTPPKCLGVIDTLLLAREHALSARPFVLNNSLESLARVFGIIPPGEKQKHQADDDVRITIEVLKAMSAALFVEKHIKPLPGVPHARHDAAEVAQVLAAGVAKPAAVAAAEPGAATDEAEEKELPPLSPSDVLKHAIAKRIVHSDKNPVWCSATTTSGGQCKNKRGPTGLCNLHVNQMVAQEMGLMVQK